MYYKQFSLLWLHIEFLGDYLSFLISWVFIWLRGELDKQLKEKLTKRCWGNPGLLWYNNKSTHGEYKTKEEIRITRGNSLAESSLAWSATLWLKRSLPFFSANAVLNSHNVQVLEEQAPLLIRFVPPLLQLSCLSSISLFLSLFFSAKSVQTWHLNSISLFKWSFWFLYTSIFIRSLLNYL